MKLFFSIYTFIFFLPILKAQSDLDRLVTKAWEKDKLLKSQYFKLEQAQLAFNEAKSMYGPSANFGLTYTLAAGGRSIDLPIGDLLNPVYTTLNQLTQTQNFNLVQNTSTNFLPNNFYDAKISVTQPIFYPELALNKKLKSEEINLKQLEIKAYKRMLSKEVMLAAINTSMAEQVIKVLADTEVLLQEAKRSTSSLIKNGVALPSALSRIESQIASVSSQKIESQNNLKNAKAYLYFLTNDSLSSSKIFEGLPEEAASIGLREELEQLESGKKMLTLAKEKESLFYKPRIGAQLDFGSQDFNFGFTPFALLGLNMQINLFDNNRNKIRKEITNLSLKEHQERLNQVEDQLVLQSQINKNNLEASIQQSQTFLPRIEASKKIYNEVFTKYKDGIASYLELVDAQTQFTNTSIQYNISKYSAWQKWAEYLYTIAAYPIQ